MIRRKFEIKKVQGMSNSDTLLGMLHSEENGNLLYRNAANYLPVDTAQHPKKHSPSTPL